MQSTGPDTAEAIIDAIRAAFAGVPRGAVTIHEAEVIDEHGSKGRRFKARRLDTESRWDRVPDADIEQCTTALCHLDPESWRYYIPAYMIWSLKNFRSNGSIVVDFTIYTFNCSSNDPEMREHYLAHFRLLNLEQSTVVCRFLRYMAAHEDLVDGRVAESALREYWGKFCGGRDSPDEAIAPAPAPGLRS